MELTKEQIYQMMNNERYPLSLKYNPEWIIENSMGAHCLWLQESLTQVMNISPGMRILDMGCGKAISSIFLAKEFGTQVWATDLWNSSSDNWLMHMKSHLMFLLAIILHLSELLQRENEKLRNIL